MYNEGYVQPLPERQRHYRTTIKLNTPGRDGSFPQFLRKSQLLKLNSLTLPHKTRSLPFAQFRLEVCSYHKFECSYNSPP